MDYTAQTLVIDICIISVLLVVGKLLRLRVKLFQNLFIPTSLIAGTLGLLLGRQGLHLAVLSDQASSYSGLLFPVLFATLFLGKKEKLSFKKAMHSVGDTIAINGAALLLMQGLAALIGVLILPKIFPGLSEMFGSMMASGFAGGHGTAAAFGDYFLRNNGWEEALTIGQTFASIGLICGAVFGVAYINYASKKGYTRAILEVSQIPESERTGLIEPHERESMGANTINPMSLDALTWHLVLILTSVGCAYLFIHILAQFSVNLSVPVFGLALIFSIGIQNLLIALKLDGYVDRDVIVRIGSCVTDFLIAFAIATLDVGIVITYLAPLVLMSVIGLIIATSYVFVLSRYFAKTYWFERGIYIFGWATGVMAIGFTLLRISDPLFETQVLEDSGLAWTILSFLELFMVTTVPIFLGSGRGALIGVILTGGALLILAISAKVYGIQTGPGDRIRNGETDFRK